VAALESFPDASSPLRLEISVLDGVARVRVTETQEPPRWEVPDVLVVGDEDRRPVTVLEQTSASLVLRVSDAETLAVSFEPFRVELRDEGGAIVSANADDLFHFEQRRLQGGADGSMDQRSAQAQAEAAAQAEGKKIVDWGEDGKPVYEDGTVGEAPSQATPDENEDKEGLWKETWGGHTDSKPHGPTAVAMDVRFHNMQHTYGIPEHASSMALKPTDGSSGSYSEPYRLYNLDVFEYELDEPMALYGSIPFMLGHRAGRTVGVFWLNPSETFVDVKRDGQDTSTHWISESGVVDLFLLAGPAPLDVMSQYAALTGTTFLPPRFSLAYHQCRWNYKDEADVAAVDAKFEEHDFPYDVLWLDIEHTDGKRYFTWDKHAFPTPEDMQRRLASRGRKMVTIVDPHIKRDSSYAVHSEAERLGYYVKTKDGSDFDGWCWPGSSSYLDFTDGRVREWWADRFSLDNYAGSTEHLYTWNDMNEPSVFNGPEVSMPKDAKSLAGVEHREWHNLYGFYQHMATARGLVKRSPSESARPFVLSRAFFAGSQRHGAIWTGDNAAQWSHLAASTPMLLSVSLAGLPMAGADVGGFFGNPDTELLVRWYQAGAYQPFFRAHAHIQTKRREPWLFGEDTLRLTRAAVLERYALLPLWYTLFEHSHRTGAPVMRPLWLHWPEDERTFGMDDQFLVGDALLVKPVASPGQTTTSVYLPEGVWYDVRSRQAVHGPVDTSVDTPLSKTPVFQRGGTVVPRQARVRRCSALMAHDPYTLTVALDAEGHAEGELYLDDGSSSDYQRGHYRRRRFEFRDGVLTSAAAAPGKLFAPQNTVERVVILGLTRQPRGAVVTDAKGVKREVPVMVSSSTNTVTVRKPDVPVAYDFSIELLF